MCSAIILILSITITFAAFSRASIETPGNYYTRTRNDPNHLRVSEEVIVKSRDISHAKYESSINGTTYEYFKSTSNLDQDHLIFETIDKIYRHRLSQFYIHHYDSNEDKKLAVDMKVASEEQCFGDLKYLIDKLARRTGTSSIVNNVSPELNAFFDSYARQESGILLGNTFWVGSYEQCKVRHIFDLSKLGNTNNQMSSSAADLEVPSNIGKESQLVSFGGRYCIAALKSPSWDSMISARKISGHHYFKSQHELDSYTQSFRIELGICLPNSCDSSSIERHPDQIKLLATHLLEPRLAQYDLIDLYCLPDENSPLRSWSGSALGFAIFFVVWLILVLLATLVDVSEQVDLLDVTIIKSKQPATFHNFVQWFSLSANYKKLMKISSKEETKAKMDSHRAGKRQNEQSQDILKHDQTTGHEQESRSTNHIDIDLKFLNAFKVIVMLWVINGHTMMFLLETSRNILNSDALFTTVLHFVTSATFGVDLFFCITGILTAFLIFDSGQAYRMRISTWIYLTFHRYWRLAPMYLLSFWFSKSVMQLLGSGPLWDYGTSSVTFRGLCVHESWWYPITFTSNMHSLSEECMVTSWYISSDMQFWLLSPIFIYLLARKPVVGWMFTLSCIAASCALQFYELMSNPSAQHDELIQPRGDIFMRVSHDLPELYTRAPYRIIPYLIGLLAGHYLYLIKTGKCSWRRTMTLEQDLPLKTPDVTKGSTEQKTNSDQSNRDLIRTIISYSGLAIFLIACFASRILAQYFPNSLLPHAKVITASLAAISHLPMSVGGCLMVVGICMGQWSGLVNLLSHPIWTRLSKLNYSLLLLQCEAIYYLIFRHTQVPVFSTGEVFITLFLLLVTLYPLAFLVTLVFEFPLANLEKLLLRNPSTQ